MFFRSKLFLLVVYFLCLVPFTPSTAQAKPRKGFYEGPYLGLTGGVMRFDWDVNQRTLTQEGAKTEPIIGILFGWNVFDWLAPDMTLRYTTSKNEKRREHIGGANVGLAFTLLATPLLNFQKWSILPFVKPGIAVQFAALPGDSLSDTDRVTSSGIGPSIGGGVRFLFNKYFYFGFEYHQQFLNQGKSIQNLTPGGSTLIYNGGWKTQHETFAFVGMHY